VTSHARTAALAAPTGHYAAVRWQCDRDATGPRWSGAVLLAVVVLTLACAATSEPATATPVTTGDVYRNVAKAIDRSGQTFVEGSSIKTMITHTSKPAKGATTTTERLWADARNNRARLESLGQPTVAGVVVNSMREHQVLNGMSPGQNTVPTTCHGASATVSFVLSCPDPESAANGSVQSVKSGRWHGRLGVVLETNVGPNADQRVTYRLYLDPKTWLPFARTSTAITKTSDHVRRYSSGPINSTFVKTASLPKSLFTAASIDRWASSHAT